MVSRKIQCAFTVSNWIEDSQSHYWLKKHTQLLNVTGNEGHIDNNLILEYQSRIP